MWLRVLAQSLHGDRLLGERVLSAYVEEVGRRILRHHRFQYTHIGESSAWVPGLGKRHWLTDNLYVASCFSSRALLSHVLYAGMNGLVVPASCVWSHSHCFSGQATSVSNSLLPADDMTYMKVVGCEANLVDFAALLEGPCVQKTLKDALVVTSLEILSKSPAVIVQTGA
jgi:hypothetical protein